MTVKAILLSHGHYDHIRGVLASAFNNFGYITKVLATPQTLEILASHLIEGVIYPEFAPREPPSWVSRRSISLGQRFLKSY